MKGLLSALLTYTTHYAVSKIYTTICVPNGVFGFIQGFLTIGSPLCHAGVQLISATQVSYATLITMGLTRLVVDYLPTEAKVSLEPKI